MLLSEFNAKKSNRKVIEIHEESPTSPEINRGGHNKLRNKEDYLDKRDVLFRLLSQSDTDPETKAKARERLLDLEKAAKSAGIIGENEGRENPVAAAIARRIMTQHVDLLSKHGAEKVIAAIDDVTEFVGDVEEIGSSDVSGWVREVERNLQSMGPRESAEQGVSEGAFSEIDIDLRSLAGRGDEEDLIAALDGDLGPGTADVLQNMMDELKDELASKGMTDVINDYDKMIELLWDKIVDEYGSADFNEANDNQPSDNNRPKFTGVPKRPDSYPEIKNTKILPPAPGRPGFVGKPQEKTNESLRTGEYHVATVTFADGTEKKVKIRSDEGFRDPIIKHFAQQGQTVKDITVDWSVRADENNDRPLSFVVPAKNTNLGYIKLIVHKIKNNKPVSRQEKEDLNRYLASNLMSEEDHGDLRTGWVLKAAKRAFPMAATDEEALAMWINDRVEKDVDRLDRDNDREDRDIDRLDKENDQEQRMLSQMNSRDEQIEKKIADLQSQVDVLYKSTEGRKPSALESRLRTRATAKEVSKYIAEMKKAGYDI